MTSFGTNIDWGRGGRGWKRNELVKRDNGVLVSQCSLSSIVLSGDN